MSDTRLESLFNSALQRPANGERTAYLDGACGADADLRSRVETLLRAHDLAEGFLEPEATQDPQFLKEGAERPGAVIGRYKLLQHIGEGGFGVVYMAEQLQPVRRLTALKIIKLGMDTRQVVARFESERQALALMDHPHIARVLDAGATESGRPYFVMELVKGIPITEYCDQNNLTARQRLELFIPVCQAVQHAHHKGIIHRDLKPTNVMVTLHDGRPVPKVIDFGIAKATNQRLTEKTLFTEFRQFIGTPQYMSPEQAEMSGLDIDTRSDIYSLGVMLYELLTGVTPFDAKTLRKAGYAEMQRIIREEEPPSPSAKVSTLEDQLDHTARRRNVDPAALSKLFRGDLDWIVMKAMEKDRTRRYNTANDLAEDLQRHLESQPVEAGPPSTVYKLQKFVRRNRAAVTTGLLTTVTLVLGLVLAAVGFVRANREARRSQSIADYLQEMLASADPDASAGDDLEVESVVRRARELFGADHATVAATLSALALQRRHAGDLEAAETLYRESLSIWRRLYGTDHVQVGLTLARLGEVLRDQGDDDDAVLAFRQSLAITGDLTGQPQFASCDTRCRLAALLERRGELEQAETLLREALAIRRRNTHGQAFPIASTLEQLASVLMRAQKEKQAEETFRQCIQAYRPLFPTDSLTIAWHNVAYGAWLRQRGKSQQAEPFFREAIRIYRQKDHPPRDYYLLALDGLFQVLRTREEATDEAIHVFHECMENIAHYYGADTPLMAPHLFGFAALLERRERYAEAIPLLVDGIRIARTKEGAKFSAQTHWDTLARYTRRTVLTPGLPEHHYQAARRGADALLTEQPDAPQWETLLGAAEYRLGRHELALATLRRAEIHRRKPQDKPIRCTALCRSFSAMAHFCLGDIERSRQILIVLDLWKHSIFAAPTDDDHTIIREARFLVLSERSPERGSVDRRPLLPRPPSMNSTPAADWQYGLFFVPLLSPRGAP